MQSNIGSLSARMFSRQLQSQVAAALMLLASVFALSPTSTHAAPRANNISVIPTVTSIVLSNGQLLASGTATAIIRGQTNTVPFSGVPVILGLATNQPGGATCPVLDLALGPITLDLLGLVVETSPICLEITAFENGGLLGDLLCSVANLLQGGLGLNQVLAGQGLLDPVTGATLVPGLTTAELNTLLGGIQSLLNGALTNLLQSVLTAIIPGATPGACRVLHLELGPLSLNLLGLQVNLDDCANGPVVVDITAERGRGNLLGNLLCGLSRRVDLGTTLQSLLGQIRGLVNVNQ